MRYSLSIKAEEDIIIDIFRFGMEQFGLYQAERYHERLRRCFQFLAGNPWAARERIEISPPVRIHPVEEHLVIYRIDDNNDVFIIRVRSGHEDWLDSTATKPVA